MKIYQLKCYHQSYMLPLLCDRQVALIGEQTVAFIGGQIGCPYWVTHRLPLLRAKQVAFILEDKHVTLIWVDTSCPYCYQSYRVASSST